MEEVLIRHFTEENSQYGLLL